MKKTQRLVWLHVALTAATLSAAALSVLVGCGTDSVSPSLFLGDGQTSTAPDATLAADGTALADVAIGPAMDGAGSDAAALDGTSATEDSASLDDVTVEDVTLADGFVGDAVADDAGAPDDAGPLLPPYDAGDPFGDTGDLETPAWVQLEVLVDGTTCAPVTACGGALLGTWDVAGGCFDYQAPSALKQCPGATLTAAGQARGRVTFDGVIAVRKAQSVVDTALFVPSYCVGFAGGCPAIEALVGASFPGAKCASTAAGACECAARFTFDIDDGDLYASESNQIVSTTSGKRWDYCVTGEELRYHDASPSGLLEPGIIRLRRL
jgi:hypothetical protein